MATQMSVFHQALRQYSDSCEKGKVPKFVDDALRGLSSTTAEDVNRSIAALEKKKAPGTSHLVLKSLFDGLKDYSDLIETCCRGAPQPVAVLWGGCKMIIDVFQRYYSCFESIAGQLKELTRHLKRLSEYETLFSKSERLQGVLVLSYVNIIEFWTRAERQFSSRRFVGFAKALSAVSSKRLDEILSTIQEDAANVSQLVPIIQEEIRRGENRDILEEQKKIRECLSRMSWAHHQDQAVRQMNTICDWVQGNSVELNERINRIQHQRAAITLRGSGVWLFDHPSYQDWLDTETTSNELWLHGGPGVGKSLLCAHIVEIIRAQHLDATVVTHYFTFDKKDSLPKIYRNIAFQLLQYAADPAMKIVNELGTLAKVAVSVPVLEAIIELLLSELKVAYVFLDGLDEELDDEERRQDLSTLISFFRRITKHDSLKLKLFFVSQDRQKIRSLLEGSMELQVNASTNREDIDKLFAANAAELRLEGLSMGGKEPVVNHLKNLVNGNFLWASYMIQEIREARNMKHLRDVLNKGLPESFEGFLQRKFRNVNPRYHEDLGRALSCLTYAKRPLSLDELCEAVATVDLETNHNLDSRYRIAAGQLLAKCEPFVLIENIESEGRHQTFARLAHSSLKTFLIGNPDLFQTQQSTRITSELLAFGCLKYLQQERYGKLLVRDQKGFCTQTDKDDIVGHALLNYVAKYWYRHLDDIPDSAEACQKVEAYVRSTNFHTLLQFQSLFVEGQFEIWYAKGHEDRGAHLVRAFPRWFTERHSCGESLYRQYQRAVREWNHFLWRMTELRRGKYPGELNRCLWPTLGRFNFLNMIPSTHRKSFAFEEQEGDEVEDPTIVADQFNSAGTEITLAKVHLSSDEPNHHNLVVENWVCAPGHRPKMQKSQTLQVPSDDFQRPSVAPSRTRQHLLQLTEDNTFLRVGTALYSRGPNQNDPFQKLDMGTALDDCLEELSARGEFLAVSSRSQHNTAPRDEKIKSAEVALGPEEAQESKRKSSLDYDQWSTSDTASEPNTEDQQRRSVHRSADILSQTSDSSSSIESHFKDFQDENDWEDFDASDASSMSENSAWESWSYTSSAELSDEAEDGEIWNDFADDTDSDNEGYNGTLESDSSDDDSDGRSEYSSETSSFASLEQNARRHRKRTDGGPLQMDSKKNQKARHKSKIQIFKSTSEPNSPDSRRVFRFCHRSAEQLFDSPPAFHPTEDLICWPLNPRELLFTDFSRQTFFISQFAALSKPVHPTSIRCHFSSCGQYLHTASFYGAKTPDRIARRCIIRISTYKLSRRKPTRVIPRLAYQTAIHLLRKGAISHDFLDQIPFTLTWRSCHVYVTLSSPTLMVYRVPLFQHVCNAEKTEEAPRAIFINSEDIYLPMSAEARKVFFFPEGSEEDEATKSTKMSRKKHVATVLISALSCPDDCPDKTCIRQVFTQGVHLTASELGTWKSAEHSDDSIQGLKRAESWKGGHLIAKYEKFDTSEDCDIVPFLER